jgi:hypothetical protein
MSADELAAFMTPQNSAEVVAGAEAEDEAATADEEYWRLFRGGVECIRQLRALHPNAAQLAMSADEITEYCRRAMLFPRSEAQWKLDLKVVSRLKTGPRPGNSKVLAADRPVAQACLKEAGGRSGKAKKAFINRIRAPGNVTPGTAKNRWYDATEPYGRTRRPR